MCRVSHSKKVSPPMATLPPLLLQIRDPFLKGRRNGEQKGIRNADRFIYNTIKPNVIDRNKSWYIVDGSNLFYLAERPENENSKVTNEVNKTRRTVANVAFEVRSKGGGPGNLIIVLKRSSYLFAFGNPRPGRDPSRDRQMTPTQSITRHLNLLRPLMDSTTQIFIVVVDIRECGQSGMRRNQPCIHKQDPPPEAARDNVWCDLRRDQWTPYPGQNPKHETCEYDDLLITMLYKYFFDQKWPLYRDYLNRTDYTIEPDPDMYEVEVPDLCPRPGRNPPKAYAVPRPGAKPRPSCPPHRVVGPRGVMFVSKDHTVIYDEPTMRSLAAELHRIIGDELTVRVEEMVWERAQLGF